MDSCFKNRRAEVLDGIQNAASRAGRSAAEIRLVAVAKTASDDDLHEAWQAGHRLFGHNRVQALAEHFAVLPEASWHLIGPLQRNKARKAISMVAMIETIAEFRLAEALDRLAAELRPSPLPILVQVNLTPEDGRPGLQQSELTAFLEKLAALPHLKIRGLMTMAAFDAEESVLRRHFAALRQLADQQLELGLLPADRELSMGMSQDYLIAIEEGATLVRIGRALFPPIERNS